MAAEQVAEQVAEHLEGAAEATRQLNVAGVGYFSGGLMVGFCIGFVFGYRFNREKIRAEELAKAEADVDKIREWYQQKATVAQPKPSVEDVVEERGYSTRVESPIVPTDTRPLRPPVPVTEPPTVAPRTVNVFDKDEGWDYEKELKQRNRNHPYVIHQNEFFADEPEGYNSVTWTYYAGDQILSDEHDEVVVRPELIVGMENLKKFGHGADDPNVVYIRNDKVEMEFEVVRTLKSHAVEVLGLDENDNPT